MDPRHGWSQLQILQTSANTSEGLISQKEGVRQVRGHSFCKIGIQKDTTDTAQGGTTCAGTFKLRLKNYD